MNYLNLRSDLRRWLPAVKKIALNKDVVLSNETACDVVRRADEFYNLRYMLARPLNKDELFAYSIKVVFEARLHELADAKQKLKRVFASEYAVPKSKVIPSSVLREA